MALYSRRYRRYRYGRRRLYGRRRRYRRSYARRYVNGSSRSSIRMKCNQTTTGVLSAGYGDAANDADVFWINPYSGNSGGGLVSNPLYQAYVNLYEETKMIGMKVQLSVTSIVGDSNTPSLQIYTAWDRRHGYSEAAMTKTEIKNAANSTVATALNNNVAKLSRSIYASDLMEKAQWHDSSLDAVTGDDKAWNTAALNPNFFCPSFFLFFNSPSLGAVHNINFSLSVTYYVAFRNPKYGGSSGAKDLPAKDVAYVGDVDDNLYMEDEATLLGTENLRGGPPAAAGVDVEPLVDTTRGGKRRLVQRTAHIPVTSTKN